MISKKRSIVIAAVTTVLSFFTIAWLSCNKPSQPYSCDGLVCENGGHCYQDTLSPHIPYCACPSGYEGPTCATAVVSKFIGYWDVNQHIDWSDSVIADNRRDSSYRMYTQTTSTNATFFLNNLFNDPYYDNIICNIDSVNSSYFTMDTLSNFHMYYDHYKILWGNGIINQDTILAHMYIKFKNKTSNWQFDSLTLRLYLHHF